MLTSDHTCFDCWDCAGSEQRYSLGMRRGHGQTGLFCRRPHERPWARCAAECRSMWVSLWGLGNQKKPMFHGRDIRHPDSWLLRNGDLGDEGEEQPGEL